MNAGCLDVLESTWQRGECKVCGCVGINMAVSRHECKVSGCVAWQ